MFKSGSVGALLMVVAAVLVVVMAVYGGTSIDKQTFTSTFTYTSAGVSSSGRLVSFIMMMILGCCGGD